MDEPTYTGMTLEEYLNAPETNWPRELTYGILREPPAPFFSHQGLVLRIARMLCDHVEPRGLGQVAIAPVDVILDRERALVVQPDVLFVASDRLSIIHNQVWGAPDLVVEVLSPGTEAHDRTEKLGWYRQYGVRECWLVDPLYRQVAVVDFTGPGLVRHLARGTNTIHSTVLPELSATAAWLLA